MCPMKGKGQEIGTSDQIPQKIDTQIDRDRQIDRQIEIDRQIDRQRQINNYIDRQIDRYVYRFALEFLGWNQFSKLLTQT